MLQVWSAIAVGVQTLGSAPALPVQFSGQVRGQTVTVCLDGRFVETTFAGKLSFRDANRRWISVCADVRAPISGGQRYVVGPVNSRLVGGGVTLAGNIVAKWFNAAQSAEQCAGLQLAVWEAIEDGGLAADFSSGRFQAKASPVALAYARKYYQAAGEDGEAVFLQAQGGGAGGGGGQSQISSIV